MHFHPMEARMPRTIPIRLMAVVALLAALPLQAQLGIAELTRRSSIIFSGTITAAHGTTDGVPADERNATVRVDRVRDTPAAIGILPKQTVTVRAAGLQEGIQRIFFTQPFFIAATLGLYLAGSQPAEEADEITRHAAAQGDRRPP